MNIEQIREVIGKFDLLAIEAVNTLDEAGFEMRRQSVKGKID
jgi:hypothetical protein